MSTHIHSTHPTVLIAGALGAIGRPLTRLLVARGFRVAGTTRRPERAAELLQLGAIPVMVDVFEPALLTHWMKAVRPEVVVHQLTDLPRNLEPGALAEALARNARVRTLGTANLVQACRAAQVGYLVAQSIAWAYAPSEGPADETFPLDAGAQGTRATTVQGVIALERAVLETPGIDGCVLRYGRLYGPGTGSDTSAGKDMPLHVDAAAWAAALAIEHRPAGVFNVAEANAKVQTDKVQRVLGWEATLRVAAG